MHTLDELPKDGPAHIYCRAHPEVESAYEETPEARFTFGQRLADKLAALVGSWPFIVVQSFLLAAWIAANVWLITHHRPHEAWDPYPFILLNLVLSFQAAYTGPVVMMSQNRQAQRDRQMAQNDLNSDLHSEEALRVVLSHLVHQDRLISEKIDRLETLLGELTRHAGTGTPAR